MAAVCYWQGANPASNLQWRAVLPFFVQSSSPARETVLVGYPFSALQDLLTILLLKHMTSYSLCIFVLKMSPVVECLAHMLNLSPRSTLM